MAEANEIIVTDEEWSEYKTKHNKSYTDNIDENNHRNNYLKNKKKIIAHNENYKTGQVTYQMGINQFSDMTKEEIASIRGCPIKFDKVYEKDEDQMRREIYHKTKILIRDHNKKYDAGEVTYTLGINQFADKKPDEACGCMRGGIRKKKTDNN